MIRRNLTQIVPADGRHWHGAKILPRILPLLAVAALIFATIPNSGCGKGVFQEVTPTTTATAATATPSSTPTQALTESFTMRGSGDETGSNGGTCSGQTCSASGGTCECLKFTGTLSSALVGNATWTASLTVNLDDCTNTGTPGGFCCTGDSLLSTSGGKATAPDVLALSFTGPVCADPASGDVSFWGAFIVLPASSSGKFANAVGTGQINLFTEASSVAAYLTSQGDIDLLAGP